MRSSCSLRKVGSCLYSFSPRQGAVCTGDIPALQGIPPQTLHQESYMALPRLKLPQERENVQFKSSQEMYLLIQRKLVIREKQQIQNLHNLMFITSRLQYKVTQCTKNKENVNMIKERKINEVRLKMNQMWNLQGF